MMIHEMKLNNEPFTLIKAGTKVIEMRLNDEKRRKIKMYLLLQVIWILKIMTEVINLHNYQSFAELYKHFNKKVLGYSDNEAADPADMNKYYSKEEQDKYGVLGIEIKLVK